MKNKDLYKTVEERIHKFREYCGSHICSNCPAYSSIGYSRECVFLWLELPALKPMPCPFCGRDSITITIQRKDSEMLYGVKCSACEAAAPLQKTKEAAIAEWNRRVK